jgi:hypothetical protein
VEAIFNGGWQKRGSGWNYNSNTGTCTKLKNSEHELDHDIQTIVVFFKHYGVIPLINWTIS